MRWNWILVEFGVELGAVLLAAVTANSFLYRPITTVYVRPPTAPRVK